MQTKTHHSIEIPKLGILKYLPKELSHCTQTHYTDVCNLLYQWQCGKMPYETFRVQAVYRLLNLRPGRTKLNQLEYEAMHINLATISELIDSFFTKNKDGDLELKLNITQNKNVIIRPLAFKWMGPLERFTNTSYGQFEDALHVYQMYFKTKSTELLHKLMAIYYLRPGNQYNKKKLDKKAKLIGKYIDFGKVYGFFLFFKSFVGYVTSSKVMVEGNVIDMSILYDSSGDQHKSDIPGLGIKSIIYQLAESGVFGKLEELRNENFWEVKLRLYDLRKRDLDHQAELKKQEAKNKG